MIVYRWLYYGRNNTDDSVAYSGYDKNVLGFVKLHYNLKYEQF